MTRTRRIAALALAALVTATSPAARAATCTATATGVAFGNYDPTAAAAATSTGQVTVACSRPPGPPSVNYTIALGTGSGSFAGRTLTFGGATLSYQLYTDATHGTVWGDGSGGTATIGDSYSLGIFRTVTRNYSVYSRIPAGQWPAAGAYSDLIVVTVTY